jgi:ABC-2 type transport system ATP-binding protein
MSLSIRNLSKSYGPQLALDNININIEKNEIIGLLGPNGAGKSTLMKSIVGAIAFDEGQIEIMGHDNQKSPLICKKNIGFLPENNPLYLEMYVQEYLQFVANLHQCSSDRIAQVIDLVGLGAESHKKIHQLSKGYKQRVGLAASIMHQPEILILDEPTNGLDPNQIIEIRGLIKAVSAGKITILSTHIMQEVEALCNRVILIHQGKIIKDGTLAQVRGDFASLEEAFHAYTK